MGDLGPLNIIPEQQEARFMELMDDLREAWQESPEAPKQLMEVASIALPGVPVLSDPAIRESAMKSAQIIHGQQGMARLIGDMDGHTDLSVEFRTEPDGADFFSLQRQAGEQTMQFSLSFIGREFQGASLMINNTGGRRIESEQYFVTRRGLLHIKNGTASDTLEGARVDLRKLSNTLVNKETRLEPIRLNALFADITTPPPS